MSELKPCPFCGGEASKRLFYKGKYRVHCNVCDAHSGDVCDTEAEAIAAWNSRADYHGYEQAAIEAWESIKAWNSRAERTCFADEVTHRDCKYSVNRGWRERTCKFTIEDNMNETEGMGDVWIECSACHCVFDFYADEWLMKMSYCPYCGAKVVGA